MASQLPPTPYINGSLLLNNRDAIGKTVRLVGKVTGMAANGNNTVQIEACDGRIVVVVRPRDAQPYQSPYICVTGTVQPDFSINEGTCEAFGDNFSTNIPTLLPQRMVSNL